MAVRVAAMLARRLLLQLFLLAAASDAYGDGAGQPPISRRSFPEGFIFGTASSAYQVRVQFIPFTANMRSVLGLRSLVFGTI